MTIELPTQPIPTDMAEASAWLSAAERHNGRGSKLHDRLAAGDALDTLTDVEPPYPPIDTARPTGPLAEIAPHVIASLERVLANDLAPADRLRVARALSTLRQALG